VSQYFATYFFQIIVNILYLLSVTHLRFVFVVADGL
jgi:hypothetical protein